MTPPPWMRKGARVRLVGQCRGDEVGTITKKPRRARTRCRARVNWDGGDSRLVDIAGLLEAAPDETTKRAGGE